MSGAERTISTVSAPDAPPASVLAAGYAEMFRRSLTRDERLIMAAGAVMSLDPIDQAKLAEATFEGLPFRLIVEARRLAMLARYEAERAGPRN